MCLWRIISVCYSERIIKIDESYAEMKKGPVFWLTVYNTSTAAPAKSETD